MDDSNKKTTFKELGLNEKITRALDDEGYEIPTTIQEKAIPLILQGKDLLAGSQTGSGKTASFALPILEQLNKDKNLQKTLRALILAPTRELAAQIEESFRTYGKYSNLSSQVIFGGVSIEAQKKNLRKGLDILVATPGRLLDLLNQKEINLSKIQTLVLDEADRMLDMGFIHDIKKILKILPEKRQNLLFSATFSNDIKKLAQSFLRSPIEIHATEKNQTSSSVKHVIHPVDTKRKSNLLSHLIIKNKLNQVLVFTRTKHGANKLCKELFESSKIKASAIHGNKSQSARERALKDFKEGKIQALIATDIAARGIDIEKLPYVINFDLPNVAEDYVHRIGRTGRAGSEGNAISLVSIDEHEFLKSIEKLLNKKIPKIEIAGFEPNPLIKANPINLGGRNQNFNKRGSKSQSSKKAYFTR
jgi:ATP-dependent RNA helicase RhlE